MKNRAMSSTIATVFLVMISMAAVALIWGAVFPFIEGEIDIESYGTRLDILTQGGYTVYDPSESFAMVQVGRTNDKATLKGIELFIDFNGTGYKTTLRSPNPGATKRYVFNLTKMTAAGLSPGYASVAPVFLEGGKEIVGAITGYTPLPYAKISVDIEDLVLEIENSEDDFVIELNESVLEQDLYCEAGKKPDAWDGCYLATGDLTNITDGGFGVDLAWLTGVLSDSWETDTYIRFHHSGTGNSACLVAVNLTDCFLIGSGNVDPSQGFVNMGGNLELTPNACADDNYYVYDNSDCE